jgi:hypothetical protein
MEFDWRVLERSRKTLARIVDIWTQIWTWDLPNVTSRDEHSAVNLGPVFRCLRYNILNYFPMLLKSR